MRVLRAVVVTGAILGVSTAAFAGDLQQSGDKAAQEQGRARPTHMDRAYFVPGVALFAAGMSMVVYGWLHTNSGDFVSGEVTKESKTGLGAAGIAVAGLGGATLYFGSQRAKRAPSVTVGMGRVTIDKRLSW